MKMYALQIGFLVFRLAILLFLFYLNFKISFFYFLSSRERIKRCIWDEIDIWNLDVRNIYSSN